MIHSSATLPLLAFLWGLIGGFSHCIGMCGIFVVTYSSATRPGAGRSGAQRHLLFHGGRLLSLVSLGAIGGLIGTIDHNWAKSQGWISLGAGILMVALALGFSGLVPAWRIPEPDVLGAGGGRLRKVFVHVLQSDHVLRPLLIGVFVGLLPCGLIYQALIPATLSGSAGYGALTMLLFGLGGVPGLLTLALLGNAAFARVLTNPVFRLRMTYVASAIMAVIGAAFVLRAVPNL
jgi:sulfite exporter TauE/SafE